MLTDIVIPKQRINRKDMKQKSQEITLFKPILLLFLQTLVLFRIFHILSTDQKLIYSGQTQLILLTASILILGFMIFKSLGKLKDQEIKGISKKQQSIIS